MATTPTPTLPIDCGNCGRAVGATVVSSYEKFLTGDVQRGVTWLLCPSCHDGSVLTGHGGVYPPSLAAADVRALPDDVENAWWEARIAHSVGAFTAGEMICRKILMHVAVDIAGSDPGKSFVSYVNDLEAAGYITRGLKQVVDLIRNRGNIANHELPASTSEDALRTLTIVEHLLRGTYELPRLAP